MFLQVFALLAIAVGGLWARPIAPRKVVYAVDCGGIRDIKSSLGVTFLKDANYSKEVETLDVDYYIEPEMLKPHVRYSPDTHIYMSERHSETNFKYFIPLQKDWQLPNTTTDYVLILKFAEFYFKEAGRRVFNVGLGNQLIVKDLDVFSLVGFSTAHDEYIELRYEGGHIYFKGKRCDGAITSSNELAIEFIKTDLDNPMIHALLLFQGTLEETDYRDREEYRNSWEQRHGNFTPEEKKATREAKVEARKQHVEHRQSIIKVREGFEHEIEIKTEKIDDEDEEEQDRPKQLPMSWELFKFMLTTPLGIVCIIGFLMSTFVLFAFTFFDPYGQKKLLQEIEIQSLRYHNRILAEKKDTQESSTSSLSGDSSDQHEQTQQQVVQRQQPEPEPVPKKQKRTQVSPQKVGKVQPQNQRKNE